ncbi:MAG: SemiSWEET family transporter [Pseudolactococcus laudensis]
MKKTLHLLIGSIGAVIGLFVFLAYIPQIMANLSGDKSQPWQPLIAAISCLIWILYGFTNEPKKDYILIIPNVLGVILGTATFLTSL